MPERLRGTNRAEIELFCQSAYFIFQVVQYSFITTLTSAASTAIFDIPSEPAPDQRYFVGEHTESFEFLPVIHPTAMSWSLRLGSGAYPTAFLA